MHDYYRIKLSESLIFLGFSRLLAFNLTSVIWREEMCIIFSATMHDYGVIKLSESLIFLGFSRISAFDLMGVIWREEEICQNTCFLGTPKQILSLKTLVFRAFSTIPLSCIMRRRNNAQFLRNEIVENVVFSIV